MGENEKIADDVPFGFCRGCQKWVPRVSMVGTNIKVYGAGVDAFKELIRVRLCQSCHQREREQWAQIEWEPTLHNAGVIRRNQDLADKCDLLQYEEGK